MHPNSERNLFYAFWAWFGIGVLVVWKEIDLALYARPLIFFAVLTFWYFLSLRLRERVDGTWVPYFDTSWLWDIIVTFELFLIPVVFLSLVGVIYAFTGILNFKLSLLITVVVWIGFYLYETIRYHGNLSSSFSLSDLNFFAVFGIILDVVGIVLSVMDMIDIHPLLEIF